MKKIIAMNAGSSSIKFQLLEMPSENVIASGVMERIGQDKGVYTLKFNGQKFESTPVLKDHSVGVQLLLNSLIENKVVTSLDEISGVGHRVVQGGETYKDSSLITDELIKNVIDLTDLAPLHNPANVTGIKAFQEALPNVPQVAVFDTVFHQTMPAEAFSYAVPYEWYTNYGVRKYGFHGTSHKFVSERAVEILGIPTQGSKIIVCHIGNGASICAVQDGKSVDTSMGLSPLAGTPMGTRSGSIDPAIVEFIARKENKSVEEVLDVLNKKSGYLGVSGISSDSRDVEKAMLEGNERATLTFNLQAKSIVDYIAQYFVLMGGVDAICFTAGLGENSSLLRKNVVDRLGALGIKLDEEANKGRADEILISTKDSKAKVYIIPTNEEVMIARDTMRIGKL